MIEARSVSNDVQRSENERKNSFLNYYSPALTAELQAHVALAVIFTHKVRAQQKSTHYRSPLPTASPSPIERRSCAGVPENLT